MDSVHELGSRVYSTLPVKGDGQTLGRILQIYSNYSNFNPTAALNNFIKL